MASAILYEIRREDNGSGEFVLIEHRRVMVQIDSQLLAPTHLAASSGTLVAGNSDDALSRGALYIFERAEAFANRQNSISTSPSPTAAVAFPLKPKKCSAQEGLAVAEEVVCVIDGDSRVHCWGRDSCGNLGLDDEKVRSVSTDSSQAVHLPARAVSVSVGGFMLREISLPFGGQACAVLIDGRLYCWGRPGSHVSEVKPEQVDIGNRVAVSTSGVYVLFNDGSFGRVFRYREDEPLRLQCIGMEQLNMEMKIAALFTSVATFKWMWPAEFSRAEVLSVALLVAIRQALVLMNSSNNELQDSWTNA